MTDADDRREVEAWMQEQRRADYEWSRPFAPRPASITVSREFYQKLRSYLYEQSDSLGMDIATWRQEVTFRRIPVVPEQPVSDDVAFIRAICLKPADDLPRLVYADWLMENGQDDRAEFIRAQCELARMPYVPERHWRRCPKHTARVAALRSRERELLNAHHCHWWHPWSILHKPDRPPVEALTHQVIDATFRRGFVEEVRLTWADCSAHLDAIRQRTPIRKVVLTTWPALEHPLAFPFTAGSFAIFADAKYAGIEFDLPPVRTNSPLTGGWTEVETVRGAGMAQSSRPIYNGPGMSQAPTG